jgi:hypothetical protein
MSDPERKKKMISLRLSDAEYALLKAEYRTHGARNISDLARLALERILNESVASHVGFAGKLADLDHRVNTLESQVTAILTRERVMS